MFVLPHSGQLVIRLNPGDSTTSQSSPPVSASKPHLMQCDTDCCRSVCAMCSHGSTTAKGVGVSSRPIRTNVISSSLTALDRNSIGSALAYAGASPRLPPNSPRAPQEWSVPSSASHTSPFDYHSHPPAPRGRARSSVPERARGADVNRIISISYAYAQRRQVETYVCAVLYSILVGHYANVLEPRGGDGVKAEDR